MQKRLFGKTFVTILLSLTMASIILCSLPSEAYCSDKVVKWNFNMWGGRRAWTIPITDKFIPDMAKHTNGQWQIKMHLGGVLAPPKEVMDGIKAGMFEATGVCVAYHPGKLPLHRVLELPFIAPTKTADIQKLVHALWEHPALKNELLKWNAVPFLPAGICTYHLMGNKAIRTVADLKGARIRMGGDIAKVLAEFGAVPTLVPAPEVYETIARGTIDLVGFPYTYAYGSYKVHEVSKYLSIPVSLGTMNCPAVANKDAYDALPEEFKRIHKVWYDNAPYIWADQYQQADDKWVPIFRRKLQFIEFPASERAKLVAKAQPIWEKWVKEMEAKGLPGRDVLNYLLKKRKEIAGE